MIGTPEQDAFINRQRWAVVTTLRRDGSPASSVIFYAREGDDLLFSTTRSRLKAKSLLRDNRIAFCVLDEGAPFNYLTVEGTATVSDADLVREHVLINRSMRRDESFVPPEGFEARLRGEGRVVIRVHPTRVSGVTGRK